MKATMCYPEHCSEGHFMLPAEMVVECDGKNIIHRCPNCGASRRVKIAVEEACVREIQDGPHGQVSIALKEAYNL